MTQRCIRQRWIVKILLAQLLVPDDRVLAINDAASTLTHAWPAVWLASPLACAARLPSRRFPHDLIAGLSVAAVALPVAVAYAQLAGFSPAVGLHASILPLVVYALFGTSRAVDGRPRCRDLRRSRRS